jgi:hypothetical protein
MLVTSHIHPSTERRQGNIGTGLYVRQEAEPIAPHEIVAVKLGHVLTGEELKAAGPEVDSPEFRTSLWVGPGLYIGARTVDEVRDTMTNINHSHAFNAFMWGAIGVACDWILPGQQVTMHYADFERDVHVLFKCRCGAPNCPGKFTGNDWKDPAYQRRHRELIMWHEEWRLTVGA